MRANLERGGFSLRRAGNDDTSPLMMADTERKAGRFFQTNDGTGPRRNEKRGGEKVPDGRAVAVGVGMPCSPPIRWAQLPVCCAEDVGHRCGRGI